MQKKHKVLMLVENLSVPADPRVWREAQALRNRGFQVSIICPQGVTCDQEAYTCIENIHIYRYSLPTTTCSAAGYIMEFATALFKTFVLSLKIWLRHGFDVIHAANPPDIFFVIGLFYQLFDKKYIFDQHDLAPEMFHVKFQKRPTLLERALLFLERCSYRTADIVITTNESQKRMAIERGRCSPEKVFVVRNGPDMANYTHVAPELSLKRGRRYMLAYVGVMGSQDGVEYVLYALNDLIHKRGRQDVELTIIGDGDQRAALEILSHRLQLEEYVHFTGWVTRQDMLRYLTMADIGLSPDPSSALNDRSTMLKTMEYMAMGKPVVAFDLPETRFSAQDAALYATPNSIEEFADKIEELLADAELRIRMGTYGYQRIVEELCWEHTRQHLWRAYDTLFSVDSMPLPEIPLPVPALPTPTVETVQLQATQIAEAASDEEAVLTSD